METGLIYRICAAWLRLIARVVPRRDRDLWLQEWDAELGSRWTRLAARNQLNGRQQMNLLRRTFGSLFDAAWLRRQFTRDAEAVHDMRHGLRLMRRRPAFAITAVLVLALGMGVTVGLFSVIDTLLVRSLPYADADRTVMIWEGPIDNPAALDDPSPAHCYEWRELLAQTFAHVACAEPWSLDYTGGAEPVVLHAAQVTEGFFQTFGTNVMLGRTFLPEEHRGSSGVVILAHHVWQQTFGSDRAIIGRSIVLDGDSYTVVGVLPPTFHPRLLQSRLDRALFFPKVLNEADRRDRGTGWWNVVARLKPGVTLAQAQDELNAVSRRLEQQFPDSDRGIVARAQPLRDHLAGNMLPALRLLFAAVGLLLLIGAANVANLLLARATERTRELAVRSAIGAGRMRLVRQMLSESLLLAVLGGAGGLVVAWWTIRAIAALGPSSITSLAEASLDSRAIVFALALTGIVAVAVGIIPAWQHSGIRLLNALRGMVGATAGARHPLRATIVVTQVALSVLLVTGAALLTRSFITLLRVDPGFEADRLVALQVFAWDRNATPQKRVAFFQEILARAQADPQLRDVGAVSAMPFIEANINISLGVRGDRDATRPPTPSFLTFATPGFFRTLLVPVREGRIFTDDDRFGTQPVAVVSESLARDLWPGESAIGRQVSLRIQGREQKPTVVGVVADIRHDGLDRPARAEIFVPHAQFGFGSMTFVARASADPAAAIDALKRNVRAVDPSQAIYRAATADELVSNTLVERRFMLALLGGFALLAGVLCAVGIYGVVSVATAQRTREFGVRIALGAQRREILQMVLREGGTMAGLGLAIGLAGSIAFGGIMSRFLFDTRPSDPLTLGAVIGVLGVTALVACVPPARRATRIDPLAALRNE